MIEFNLCRFGRHGDGFAPGGLNQGAGNIERRQFGWGNEADIACKRVLGSPWAFGCLPWLPPERLVVP